VVTGGSANTTATLTVKRKGTNEVLLATNNFDLVGTTLIVC
jgi:hypothetical protein